jgi:preprotein translocase subunit SecE
MRLQAPPAATTAPRSLSLSASGKRKVAKVSVGEFMRQVKVEGIQKVHWPTRPEVFRTAVMVLIMTGLLALFFLATDSLFSAIVQFLLGLVS